LSLPENPGVESPGKYGRLSSSLAVERYSFGSSSDTVWQTIAVSKNSHIMIIVRYAGVAFFAQCTGRLQQLSMRRVDRDHQDLLRTMASSLNFLARDLQEKTHNVFNGHEQNAGAQNNFDYAHGDVFLATGGLEKYKNSYFNA
jgi:hypothetical protein